MKIAFSAVVLLAFLNICLGKSKALSFESETTYELTVLVDIPAFKNSNSEEFSLWIPFPSEIEEQEVISYKADSRLKWQIGTEDKFRNRMLYTTGLTSGKITPPLKISFVVKRRPQNTKIVKLAANDNIFLLPTSMIPLNHTIKHISQIALGGESDKSKQIPKLYQYVVSIMSYDKSGTGWGHGDAIWACSSKRGNCTDFHSLLIAMARVNGIPAKFNIGVPINPKMRQSDIPGYHCWAQLYDEEQGWIPVDASESKKKETPASTTATCPVIASSLVKAGISILLPNKMGRR